MVDGVGAIALILIGSFGIDRIVTGLLVLLSFLKPWARVFPDPAAVSDSLARLMAERKQKIAYFIFAGILGGVILAYFGEVRIFRALGFEKTNGLLDAVMTGLILVAGADRLSPLLQLTGPSGSAAAGSQPIEITGKLILEGEKVKEAGLNNP